MAAKKTTTKKAEAPANLKLWDALAHIDKKHVKKITGKAYKGDSAKPQAVFHKMTEGLGPVGTGWGYTIMEHWTQEFPNKAGEIDRIDCMARVRIRTGSDVSWEYIGQCKMMYYTQKGVRFVDDDAYKKAVTDALTKGLAVIGVAAEIHMGEFDPRYEPQEPETQAPPAAQPETEKSSVSPGRQLKAAFDARCKKLGIEADYADLDRICQVLDVDKNNAKSLKDAMPKLMLQVAKYKGPPSSGGDEGEPESEEQDPLAYMHGAIAREFGLDRDSAHELLHGALLDEHEGSLKNVKTMKDAAALVKRAIALVNEDEGPS